MVATAVAAAMVAAGAADVTRPSGIGGAPGRQQSARQLLIRTRVHWPNCESVDSGIMNTTTESFDRHFAVNARAVWLLIREYALQNPDRNGGGRIIALTSDHAVHNLPFGASKGALDRIVIAAARDSQITRSPPT